MRDGKTTSNVLKGTIPIEDKQTSFGNDAYSESYMVMRSGEAPYGVEGYAFLFSGEQLRRKAQKSSRLL